MACFSHMVGPTGLVVGIDHLHELVEMSKSNIRNGNPEIVDENRLKIVFGDGRKGWPANAPYDAIHVGAAAPKLPSALVDQLKPGGRLICPVGSGVFGQNLEQVDKGHDGKITKKKLMGVMFVPLTDAERQRNRGMDGNSVRSSL